jgi:hypothetical protein
MRGGWVTGQLVPALKTPVTVPGLYVSLQAAWRTQMGAQAPRDALRCLLAQWALETGRGKWCVCFNLGNAKHVAGDGRDWCSYEAFEMVSGRKVVSTMAFRAFPSLDAGASDYLAMLRNNFGTAWSALVGGDPHAFVQALAAAKYFTANEAQYEASLCAIFAELDREVPPDVVAPVVVPHAFVGPDADRGPPDAVS